jgi:hypothetical protein
MESLNLRRRLACGYKSSLPQTTQTKTRESISLRRRLACGYKSSLPQTTQMTSKPKIPLPVKIIFALFMAFYVPIYWVGYGPQNFLWMSDVLLMLTFIATLTEWQFLASMAAVGGILFESLWTIDFLITIIARAIGSPVAGFTIYMFDPFLSLPLRLIGLFHLALPPYLFWLIFRLGYHSKAWMVQVLLTWFVALVTWLVTSPLRNINFVFSYLKYDLFKMGALPFFLLGFLAVFIAIGATHLLLRAIFNRSSR